VDPPPEDALDTPDAIELTRFLNDLGHGDVEAEAALMPHVYAELQRIARGALGGGAHATLQPTALVHSAFARLFGSQDGAGDGWNDRKHFFVVAAKAMRQVVVDHARRRGAVKRGGGRAAVTLDEGFVLADEPRPELLDLDEALRELEAQDPRQARVVELRWFAGLEVTEVAAALDVSRATVERDWRFARAWLARRMGESEES
jgi:RNA polymerase sigma factor (TIGR02999 family)